MSVSIDIEKVVKKYGSDIIINGLSLHIEPGEFFTLLGPSGCGKTTLLRMIIGFNSIEGGTIKIDGRVVNDIPTNNRNMGMVFQNYAIFPHMSVKDNVAFGLRTRNIPQHEIEEQVDAILKVVKIHHLKDRMPVKLSGGQQQRVALARAIVIHPEVLLMDEPLSNLDAKLRVEMRNAIKSIQRQIRITTVYVTHDQEEALAISDRIAIMHNGVIQQIDSPKNIYQRPANTFVSTFIGLSNIIDGNIMKTNDQETLVVFENGYRVAMDNISPEVTHGQQVVVSIRPEEFLINASKQGLRATINSSVFLGLTTHYFVQLENGQDIQVIQDRDEQDIIPDGTSIILTVKPQKINVFNYDSKMSLIRGGQQ